MTCKKYKLFYHSISHRNNWFLQDFVEHVVMHCITMRVSDAIHLICLRAAFIPSIRMFANHFAISHASIYTDSLCISQYILRYTWYIIVCMSTYWDMLYFCVQDTILVVPPYPYCIEEERHNVPLEDCWYASPQLFFTCILRPNDGRLPKNRTYKTGPDDIIYTLIFFSTFEEPIKGPMEDAGVIKLYETPASTWQMSRIWWAEFHLSHCFWLVIRLQQSLTMRLTCSASARIQASRTAVPTLLQRTDGGAAMSMRSTSGCGTTSSKILLRMLR